MNTIAFQVYKSKVYNIIIIIIVYKTSWPFKAQTKT